MLQISDTLRKAHAGIPNITAIINGHTTAQTHVGRSQGVRGLQRRPGRVGTRRAQGRQDPEQLAAEWKLPGEVQGLLGDRRREYGRVCRASSGIAERDSVKGVFPLRQSSAARPRRRRGPRSALGRTTGSRSSARTIASLGLGRWINARSTSTSTEWTAGRADLSGDTGCPDQERVRPPSATSPACRFAIEVRML